MENTKIPASPVLSIRNSIINSGDIFHAIIQLANEGICIGAPDGMLLLVNERMAEMFGYTKDEILGKVGLDLFDKDQTSLVLDTRRTLGQGQRVSRELKGRKKDGSVIWVIASVTPLFDSDGKHLGNVSLLMDITKRKEAEEALKESEERFRTMANAIPQLAWIARPDGYIYWYNQRWYDYTGTTPEDMQGWGWQSVHDPFVLPRVLERWQQSIETGTPLDMEFPLKGADGTFRTFLTRVEPLKDSRGQVLQWLGTNTDVTERHRTELELRRLYEQVQQDAVAKADLLNEVNHRVKNNLMMILGLILAEKRRAIIDGRDDLNVMWEKFELRIAGLLKVHQMLSDSQWQPVNLAALAESVCSGVLNSGVHAGPVIDLVIDRCDINVSPRQAGSLALVFNELITNCLKYSFCDVEEPRVQVSIGRQGDRILIEFRDNGAGYPGEVIGNGLHNVGFRLIRQLIEQTLDGSLELKNDNGAVTLITIGVEAEKHA
ncbi:MAG: PAS domain S-box protein [Acidobacteriota bacterium]